jgi:transcriptional regulator with XRE-family HTH domain
MTKVKTSKPKSALPELRRLSGFIRDKATSNGLSLHGFCQKYELNTATINNYVNCQQLPDVRVLLDLARALRKETGEAIGLVTLVGLIDDLEGAVDGKDSGFEYRESVLGKDLVKQFAALSFSARLRIIPALQRQIGHDIDIAFGAPQDVAAILVADELFRQGVGRDSYAKKAGIDPSFFRSVATAKTPADARISDIRKLAEHIRDADGDYGNLQLFLNLLGFHVHISSMINGLMEERSIATVADLVDYLLRAGETSATPKQRVDLVRSIEAMIASDKMVSHNDDAYTKIIPALSKELGFDNLQQFVDFATRSCSASS